MKKLIHIIGITAAFLGLSVGAWAASPWIVNQTSATANVPVTFNQPVTFVSTPTNSIAAGSPVVASTAGCALYVNASGNLGCDLDVTGFFYTGGQVYIPFLTITNTAQLHATMHVSQNGAMDFSGTSGLSFFNTSSISGSSATTVGWVGVVTATNTGNALGGDGSKLTAITAANISGSHTLPDGTLSTNVPLLNAANAFTSPKNTFPHGTGTATTTPPGILDALIVSSGMAAGVATETTLYTYTMPANTLVSTASTGVSFPARQIISIYASGTTVPATLNEVKIYFGSTVILDSGPGNFSSSSWTVHCEVMQTGTGSSQSYSGFWEDGTATLLTSNNTTTQDITAGIVIKVTGTVSVATANGVKVTQAYVEKK